MHYSRKRHRHTTTVKTQVKRRARREPPEAGNQRGEHLNLYDRAQPDARILGMPRNASRRLLCQDAHSPHAGITRRAAQYSLQREITTRRVSKQITRCFTPSQPLRLYQGDTRRGRYRAQELCESRGGRPGLPSLIIKPTVYVDVKQHYNQRRRYKVNTGDVRDTT